MYYRRFSRGKTHRHRAHACTGATQLHASGGAGTARHGLHSLCMQTSAPPSNSWLLTVDSLPLTLGPSLSARVRARRWRWAASRQGRDCATGQVKRNAARGLAGRPSCAGGRQGSREQTRNEGGGKGKLRLKHHIQSLAHSLAQSGSGGGRAGKHETSPGPPQQHVWYCCRSTFVEGKESFAYRWGVPPRPCLIS